MWTFIISFIMISKDELIDGSESMFSVLYMVSN